VLLLDEIEKAHHDVFNVLLQLLDDGRLTDGQGRTVDFRNVVVIMTSNIGSQYIQEAAGDDEQIRKHVLTALRSEFRPELLNRIDETVIFHSLTRKDLTQIVDIQLHRLDKLLVGRGLTLELTPVAKEVIAEQGWDPQFGARPLKRAIQRLMLDPLAVRVLRGDFKPGDTVQVDAVADVLTFTKAPLAAEVQPTIH
jgi:ATP-dependent Clp protease ATP-binding subunit ClpB